MNFYVCCSWNYGSNSLPTAGSVSGGVGRRGQRQFQMTPRGLPAGRICLPGGIGGASPRHTLTNPALAGQGRQVSITAAGNGPPLFFYLLYLHLFVCFALLKHIHKSILCFYDRKSSVPNIFLTTMSSATLHSL